MTRSPFLSPILYIISSILLCSLKKLVVVSACMSNRSCRMPGRETCCALDASLSPSSAPHSPWVLTRTLEELTTSSGKSWPQKTEYWSAFSSNAASSARSTTLLFVEPASCACTGDPTGPNDTWLEREANESFLLFLIFLFPSLARMAGTTMRRPVTGSRRYSNVELCETLRGSSALPLPGNSSEKVDELLPALSEEEVARRPYEALHRYFFEDVS
mmetsp:Transcript_85703/g.239536  ORF Transcript_85703/g.239536 Transcript_85703/m.239536 type:complete len:216 (+) Transcript_85703:1964-2611(+)